MGAVNITVRVDEEIKRDFDAFCDNVGMNITTAVNLFIRAVLRSRELPFSITDSVVQKQTVATKEREALRNAFKAAQEQSVINGTDNMTMDEIDLIIAEVRQEKRREQQCKELL